MASAAMDAGRPAQLLQNSIQRSLVTELKTFGGNGWGLRLLVVPGLMVPLPVVLIFGGNGWGLSPLLVPGLVEPVLTMTVRVELKGPANVETDDMEAMAAMAAASVQKDVRLIFMYFCQPRC